VRALDRAKRDGDAKYIHSAEVYTRLKRGEINKGGALAELGSSFKNAIEIWCRDLRINES